MKTLALIALSALVSAPAQAGPKGGGGSTFVFYDIIYCWGATEVDPSCPVLTTEKYDSGDIESLTLNYPPFLVDEPVDGSGSWRTWQRGKRIKIVWDGGAVYQGTQYAEGCWEGTMALPSGLTGAWAGCEVP